LVKNNEKFTRLEPYQTVAAALLVQTIQKVLLKKAATGSRSRVKRHVMPYFYS